VAASGADGSALRAAVHEGELWGRFLPACSSGGVAADWDGESTPAGRLQARLFDLTLHDFRDCDVSLPLREAAARLRQGEEVDWVCLVDWRVLPAMREDLDLLPHPKGGEAAPAGPHPGLAETLGRLADTLDRVGTPATVSAPPAEALSKEDAARFLGVEVKTVEYLLRTRKVRYVQVGSQRVRVIPVEALRKLLQENTQLTAQEELRRRGRR
jgi:hypothetical protein